MNEEILVRMAIDEGEGIIRLAPTFVPRNFLSPGGRLKLSPEDIFALGVNRGGLSERWLASTIQADNEGAPEDEGLSYIVVKERSKESKVLLSDAIKYLGDEFIGKDVLSKFGGWMVLTKLFDYSSPIHFHLHQSEKYANRVNRLPKPEAYYFPPQLNNVEGRFPYTFFGLNPGTTRKDIKNCLKRWNKGDNGILFYSRAYKLKVGTGWLLPAGILHAPGTLVTYETQKASDVFAMYQSLLDGISVSFDLLIKDVPPEYHDDLEYIVEMIDWEANLVPEFKKNHYMEPIFAKDLVDTKKEGYVEKWIVYGSEDFSSKQLTVFPKKSVLIRDEVAYGLIVIQGHGAIGRLVCESPTMIRYGELTNDEFFVTCGVAKEGVKITNQSSCEDLVILKHFGPENPEAPNTNKP